MSPMIADYSLIDFDVLDTPKAVVSEQVPVVVERVTTTSEAVSYVMKDEQAWGWQDLRDFVIREIENHHGPQPRDLRKESGIFKSFMTRYPEHCVGIARAVFGPVHQGMWRGAPVSVNRFCKASDPYFADVLVSRL